MTFPLPRRDYGLAQGTLRSPLLPDWVVHEPPITTNMRELELTVTGQSVSHFSFPTHVENYANAKRGIMLLSLIFLFRFQLSYFHPRNLFLISHMHVLSNPLPPFINSYPVTSHKSLPLSFVQLVTFINSKNSSILFRKHKISIHNTAKLRKRQPFTLNCARFSEYTIYYPRQ